eukprot:TRINITY_DN23873_c0_g1_i2.p1 TRINITY_DN23873_c0_g1~~TRINITY_DN23873_c0_g1_i2.p1  ORF type:complete len:239 (-),score=39.05 TRINITY_DN23873_c0_g1_i2:228-944(-)
MPSWAQEKERKLGLSLEERRKEYHCGDKFIPLSDIESWDQTAKDATVDEKLKEALLNGFELKDVSVDLCTKISVVRSDITKLELDAIVNAANNSLLGGGGVDGAIHRGAGRKLLEENKTLNGCEDGEAKLSGGYDLPAKYVMSTVGPRGEKPAVLEAAYSNCLNLMKNKGLRTIAFPCISTGVYGYPNDNACEVALKTTRRFLEKNHEDVDRIIFCLFLDKDVALYNQYLPIIFPSKA